MPKTRLSVIKENLSKYRPIDLEREEGFDGHQEWNEDDPLLLEAISYFYKAVKNKFYSEVRSFLGYLLPMGTEDGRIQPIQSLLMNTSSEEALKEVLLLSIATGSRPLVEFILALFVDCPYLERSGCANSAHFAPHMTPLMLACILNNFSIVQCLLTRGHSIQIPHFLTCECRLCKRQTISNRSPALLVDVMRAVASEAYLWLGTDDVFVAACAVAHDLQQLIENDGLEHVQTYRHLEANVQRFLTRVSDQAWRSEEFNVLMANKEYCTEREFETSSPRLQMAMDSEMRQFTCSTNSQTAFKSVFRADWLNFGNKPKRDLWRLFRATILMPALVMIHATSTTRALTMTVPLARFIAHITTYVIFLLAAVVRVAITFYPEAANHFTSVRAIELFMYFYMFGLLLERALLFNRVGKDGFFAFWWRWFDAVLITSFVISFVFFVGTFAEREMFDTFETDRMHWPSGEYTLIHEIFLSISCVLAVSKCFYYIQTIKGVGGSVISIGKCVGKTYTYLLIMITIILSFSVGLNILVSPYLNRKSIHKNDVPDTMTTQSYDSLGTSSKNLFWSIFGYLGPSTYVTVVGNTGSNMEPVSHQLNSATLEILGALYHGIIIITVLNLMTSILVKKADEVIDNEELEFKYTRAAMFTEFVSWEMSAPPPLNIIFVFSYWLQKLLTVPPEDLEEEYVTDQDVIDKSTQYTNLLVTMFSRFIAAKECRYKTIWRTEFDKDEKPPNHVTFLSAGTHAFPMDNTYQGWKKRDARKMPKRKFAPFEKMEKAAVKKHGEIKAEKPKEAPAKPPQDPNDFPATKPEPKPKVEPKRMEAKGISFLPV